MIDTARRLIPMENRSEGDWLVAMDLGLPPIRWTGRRVVSLAELATRPQALRSIDRAAMREILPQFPHLREGGYRPIPARPLATGKWVGTWRFGTVRRKKGRISAGAAGPATMR